MTQYKFFFHHESELYGQDELTEHYQGKTFELPIVPSVGMFIDLFDFQDDMSDSLLEFIEGNDPYFEIVEILINRAFVELKLKPKG